MDMSTIQPLMDWLTANPTLSSIVIVTIAATESLALIGILVPGVALMLGIGALVGLNVLPLWPTLFWAFLGAVIGDGVSYWLGHTYEHQLKEVWPLSRYPRLVRRGEIYFKKHGSISIFFGRFIGPMRPIIPAVAGVMKMPPLKFYAINILSAVLWAPVVILPGVAVGASFQVAGTVALRFVILSVIIFLLLWFLVWSTGRLLKLILYQLNITGKTAINTMFGLALMAVLITYVALFVTPEMEVDKFQQEDRQVWWHKNWQNVARVSANYLPQRPINIQWWGSSIAIKTSLQNEQWVVANKMSLKNVAQWLIPELKTRDVPIWPVSLAGLGEEQIFVYNFPTENRSQILRLWPTVLSPTDDDELLWLGSLSSFEFRTLAPGISVPKIATGPINSQERSTIVGLKEVELKQTTYNDDPLYLINSSGYERGE